MALLLNQEVVGITRSIKIQVMPHAIAQTSTDFFKYYYHQISYVSRFSE